MTYIVAADIEARLGSEQYLRAFDVDGDGTADTAVVNAAILSSETIINAMLAASHTVPFTSPPQYIKDIAVMLAPYEATKFYTGNNGAGSEGPYKGLADTALEALRSLSKDKTSRLPDDPPKPTASLAGTYTALSTPWSDARGGKNYTSF